MYWLSRWLDHRASERARAQAAAEPDGPGEASRWCPIHECEYGDGEDDGCPGCRDEYFAGIEAEFDGLGWYLDRSATHAIPGHPWRD